MRDWIVILAVLVVVSAFGVRFYLDRRPDSPSTLPGDQEAEPAWAAREKEVTAQVDALRNEAPQSDESPSHPLDAVASNERPDQSAFHIADDHRVYDMRAWKPVGASDGRHSSAVVMTRKIRLKKTKSADRIDFLGRTSGSDLVMRCVKPNPEKARLYVSRAKPKVEGKEMTEHRLSIDVSNFPIGEEFELVTRTTFWNSLQTPPEQWLGAIGSDGSQLLSLLILYPESRKFRGGGLRTGSEDKALEPYTGTQVVFQPKDGSWVYWEVPGPMPGHTYRIDWKW